MLRTTFAMSSETEVFETDPLNTAFIVYDDESDDDISVNFEISLEEEDWLEEVLEELRKKNGLSVHAQEFVPASSG